MIEVADETELQAAIDNAPDEGAALRLSPGTHRWTQGVGVKRNVPLSIWLTGCRLLLSPGVIGLKVQQGAGTRCKGVTIYDGLVDGLNKNQNTIAVQFSTTDRSSWVGNWRAERCTVGVDFCNALIEDGTHWTEGGWLDHGLLAWCRDGVRFSVDAPTHPSFMETALTRCHFIGNDAGIDVGPGCSLVRSEFRHLTLWVPNNAVGVRLGTGSRIRGSQWYLAFEHQGPAVNCYGVDVDPGFFYDDCQATPQWNYDCSLHPTGRFTEVVRDPARRLRWHYPGANLTSLAAPGV